MHRENCKRNIGKYSPPFYFRPMRPIIKFNRGAFPYIFKQKHNHLLANCRLCTLFDQFSKEQKVNG